MPRPDPSTQVLLDHIQSYLGRTLGPDDRIAEVHILMDPFSVELITNYGAKVLIKLPGGPSCN